ncbi:MAG: fumarylacetoacetate hydrolase family protein [Rhodospirillaceae bacterium]|jgi:2-keto-4-pentenoate hydratase/2-oxohepta-3-ene-1,7-dioic acid hydratase in catechol pathway|nr:fumarylacetoacetate hydrolase family protein [Rhodospirillaceae bacterium]
MKFVSYEYNEGVKFGAVIDDGIIDLSDAGPSLKAVLGAGPLDNLIKVAETRSPTVDLDHVILHQVIPDTDRILCVGKNYKDHAKEMGGEVAGNPNIFMRTAQSVVGHQQSVIMPMISEQYDFEGELAVVIGRGGRHIDVDRALEHVAGYTCFLDGSVRDYQKHSFTAGKNFDSSGACGPWLVPAREIPDPQNLHLTTRINGDIMQDASTQDMIFTVPFLISYISGFTHLEPGDVLATGTPAGVGAGRTPPLWLKSGDSIDIEIEHVGTLSNTVKAEAEV